MHEGENLNVKGENEGLRGKMKVQIVPRREMKYMKGKCEGLKYRITGK